MMMALEQKNVNRSSIFNYQSCWGWTQDLGWNENPDCMWSL